MVETLSLPVVTACFRITWADCGRTAGRGHLSPTYWPPDSRPVN